MAKKRSGYSKSRKDWLGRPVTEHFNSKGEKTGRSKKHTDFLGRSVTERYNTKGEKTGYTKRREEKPFGVLRYEITTIKVAKKLDTARTDRISGVLRPRSVTTPKMKKLVRVKRELQFGELR